MPSDSQLMDSRDVDSTEENENAKEDVAEQWEKGYDLPIDEPERKEAEDECKINSYPTGGLCLGILRKRPGHGQTGQ